MTYESLLQKELEQESSLEGKLDGLRRFQKSRTLEIQKRDQAGEFPLPVLLQELTALAEAVVRGSFEIRLRELLEDQPAPRGPFAIVAMGKFGGQELTYRSDLDILYLFECPEDQELYTRLGTRIISALTLLTREGYAYRIDTALRPSGRGGTLVSTREAFRRYHREMGRTWERQSLIKARPIVGDERFQEEIQKTCEEIAYQPCSPSETAAEIDKLRRRMESELARETKDRFDLKTGRGGIVDIEFLVQYLQLIHGAAVPTVRTQNTLEAIERLLVASLLEAETSKFLTSAYLFYREIETRLRLVLDHPTDELRRGTEGVEKYLEVREKVRAAYEAVLRRKAPTA